MKLLKEKRELIYYETSKRKEAREIMEKPKTKIELNYSKVADKFFKEHPEIKEKFKEKLKNFYINSEKNVDIKIIKGIKPTQYRMRIGKYRIIFFVNKEKLFLYSIFVEKADSRGDIY